MTDNEVIAEFMGAEFQRKPDSFNPEKFHESWIFTGSPHNWRELKTKYHYTEPMLFYHTDWDWIMPVVERIQFLFPGTELRIYRIYTGKMIGWLKEPIQQDHTRGVHGEGDTAINATYQAVVKFVKRYRNERS